VPDVACNCGWNKDNIVRCCPDSSSCRIDPLVRPPLEGLHRAPVVAGSASEQLGPRAVHAILNLRFMFSCKRCSCFAVLCSVYPDHCCRVCRWGPSSYRSKFTVTGQVARVCRTIVCPRGSSRTGTIALTLASRTWRAGLVLGRDSEGLDLALCLARLLSLFMVVWHRKKLKP